MKQTSKMRRRFYALLFLLLAASCQKKPPEVKPAIPEPPSVPHHVHVENKIPTPLWELKVVPLDVYAACLKESQSECSILLLNADSLMILDWKKGSFEIHPLPQESLTPFPSRAPSGKIIPVSPEFTSRLPINDDEKQRIRYIITSNNLAEPLYFDSGLTTAYPLPCKGCPFPVATPGFNTFALRDGKFYDFDLLPESEIAVIDDKYRLNVGGKGRRAESDVEVGATLCISLPFIYTSSHSLPGQPDVLLKFRYQDGQLITESNHTLDGEIIDLLIFDLNQDGQNELILTLKNSRGMWLEVQENF